MLKNKINLYFIIITMFLLGYVKTYSQVDFYISPNANVHISQNAIVTVNGNVTVSNNASLSQLNNSSLYITHNFSIFGTFTSTNGATYFIGADNSTLSGNGTSNFYTLVLDKNSNLVILFIDKSLTINNNFDIVKGWARFLNNASRTLDLFGNLNLTSDGTFDASTTGSANHVINFYGLFNNNGTIDFNTIGGNVVLNFLGNTNVNLAGSGSYDFFEVNVNKSNPNNYVDFNKSFTASNNFLTLTQGEFRLTSNYSFSNNFFKLNGNDYTIPENSAFILDNPNVTVTPQTVAGNAILKGKLHINQGEFNIGSTGQSNLIYDNASTYAEIKVNGGKLNVHTSLYPSNTNRLLRLVVSNGELNLGTGSSNNTNNPMLDIPNTNSLFNFSGGTIKIHRGNTNVGLDDLRILVDNDTITTNSTLEITDLATNQTIELNSSVPFGNLLVNANNTPTILLKNNLEILQNITFNGTGSNIFNTQNYNLLVGGNFTNNFTSSNGFNNATGRVIFNGNTDQNIGGSQNTTFNILQINKSNGRVELNNDARVNSSIRIISNSILDINTNKLTMSANSRIYSDDGATYDFDTFNDNKCIIVQNITYLVGGSVEYEINPSVTLPYELHFPITTENVFTPLKVRLLPSGITFGSAPKVNLREYAGEHPQVEAPNVSLKKYWILKSSDINVGTHGIEITGIYNDGEVEGNEGSYQVLAFAPNYNNPSGYWRVNPGVNNYVNINTNLWYSQQASLLDADWTIGEQSAGQATYYARANGDYNDPNTWSKVYFNGPASNTAPNKLSDRVRIQDHIVTISDSVAGANYIGVEDGTEARLPGVLRIEGNHYVKGDTFKLEQNAKLYFAHQQGIVLAPNQNGAIRTTVRSLSDNAIYAFWQGQTQVSGNGIPDLVQALIIDKTAGTTATLSKNIGIRDSLIIVDGIFDLSTLSVNGYTPGRIMKMYGGELIVRSNFPINYAPPFFTAGQVTFDGNGNVTIPSETSTPGVAQYNNLKISGNPRAGNVTFSNSGKIRILGDFDISSLSFANNTYRFFTSGSTVRFVKNGNQNISYLPQSPTDSVCMLQFYNLELINPGNKTIVGTSPYPFSINNELTLDSSVTFVQNNANIEIQSHWNNLNGSVFQPTANKFVSFFAPTNSVDLNINSRDTTDNFFQNVIIRGPGNVKPQNDFVIKGNLIITSGSNLIVNGKDIFLYGNWTNNGGTFTHTNSTAFFQGNTLQTMTKTSGNETFHNLVLRNPANLNTNGVGGATNGVIVNNNLSLDFGRIDARDRFVQVGGTLTRSGGGYINSALRKTVPAGTSTVHFEVGYNNTYTPFTIYTNGSGGTTGYLQVKSDTITTTTSPISWTDATPTDIAPTGSQISPERHIARQWLVTIPSGSTFSLGTRKYDAVMHFIGYAPPNGDLRNGTSPYLVDAKVYNGTNWIGPLYYGTYPYVGNRQNDSLELKENVDFGSFIVGEPTLITYYTRNSGNWTTASNWSTTTYNGPPSSSYPGELGPNFRALIGASHQINLNTNVTLNNTPTNTSIITVDSSGVLDLGTYIISGTGEFRLLKYGTLRIGHSDGITASGSIGNIQTATRSYNFNNHNLGTFVYNGSGTQVTGNGLPSGSDSIRVLIVNKPNGTVTLNTSNNINVKDSLYIQSGTLNMGNLDIFLNGNMRLAANGTFQHNNRTFNITGAKGDTLSAESYSNPIVFYNLTINKLSLTGNTVLDNNTIIHIENNLTFSNNNRSIIDAITKSNQTTPNYVRFGTNATVTGAQQYNTAQAGGWIYGRVHKYIPANDAPNIVFEIGDDAYYTPLEIDFRSGTGSQAGYLMAQPEYGFHPRLYTNPQSLYPVNPNRVILSRWKLVKPVGSTFVRGSRNFDPTVRFPHPQYTTLLDCVGCADLTYYRGGDSLQWWQTMARNSTYDNSGTENYCSDTRIPPHPTPNFDYQGSTCTTPNQPTSFIRALNLNTNFGTDEVYANGDTLLAEFVAGNRNSIKFYNFYSIADGDWTDPNTWSTVSFNSTVNEALNDTDPNVYPFPVRQYDNALIGNGKRVRLNSDIGHNAYFGGANVYTHAGPSVKVFDTGTLDFGTRTLRGNGFNLFKGGKIIIGSHNGITTTSSGNVILGTGNIPSYGDSANFVYTAEGLNIAANNWGIVGRNASTHFIESVTIRRSSDNAIIMQSVTGSSRNFASNAHNYIWNKVANLVAGETYYVQINPSNVATSRRFKGWISYDYNTTFTDSAPEQIFNTTSADTALVTTGNFTVPISTFPGTTHLRIGLNSNTNEFGPAAGGTGEFEEYTVNIIQPDSAIAQNVGAGLPTKIASLEINSPRSNSTVTLSKSIQIVDSLKISSGTFLAGNNTIDINGAFIVDTLNGFNPQNSTVRFFGEFSDTIRSKIPNIVIPFYNLTINKAFSDTVIYAQANFEVSLTFNWATNNKIYLSDGKTIRLLQSAGLVGTFGKNRMVQISGSNNSGIFARRFSNAGGSGNPKLFTFPIGIDTSYYPVYVRDTAATWPGLPEMQVSMVLGQHPNRLTNNSLNIFWKTRFYNWNPTNVDTLKFTYRPHNVTGDTNKYIPSLWRGTGSWEIDLGTNPWAKTSPIDIKRTPYFLAIDTNNFAEWTAGEPLTFTQGRIFFSRATGLWNSNTNWSADPILKHNGPAASYFPGQLFDNDTVNIDGHLITFVSDSIKVDSLRIGGTNSSPNPGVLSFGNTTNNKKLYTRQLFLDVDSGVLEPISVGTNTDSLIIGQNLINNTIAPGRVDFIGGSHSIVLKFANSGNSNISGNGIWQDIDRVVVEKSGGLNDTLIINSNSFSTSTYSFNPRFVATSGIIRSNSGTNTRLSVGSVDLTLQPNSGLHTFNGGFQVDGNLFASANTTILLNNGNLLVGNAINKNFVYSTGSQITINNAQMSIAGGFLRFVPTSSTSLTLTHPNSAVIVGRIGYNGLDPTFDLQNAGSSISMNAGRIIVANANSASNADINISANGGTGITGGDIQLGDSTLTNVTLPFRFSGTTPIYNLHLVNDAAENGNYISRLASLEYTVKNNVTIDKKQNLDINGNTLTLQGNLLVYGTLTATPTAPTSQSWRLIINGTTDQYFRNYNSSNPFLEFYSLRINKPTGNLILGGSGAINSSIKINDHLEFMGTNNAFIDARSNNFKVIVGPNASNLGIYQVSRPALGHIHGILSRYIPNGNQTYTFQIGLDTIGAYRPLQLFITGNNNTAGYVEAIVHPTDHPDLANSGLLPGTNVPRYWAVNPATTGGFALGSGGKYNITTTFKNPDDVPNPSSLSLFEHRMYSPSHPAIGTWNTPTFLSNSTTSVTSQNLTTWGDFVVGEPNTITFYSYNSGNWQDINTWSLSGYDTPNPPTRIPNQNTDIVRIGNGKTVTLLDDGTYPQVRNVIVETYNGNPGYLQINGQLNYFKGLVFQLDDNNTLGVQHVDGIRPASEGNVGPIQTTSRTYGVSRYIFNSNTANQVTGTGLPNYVKTMVIDNSSPTINKKVFLTNYPGAPQVNIIDTLYVRQGTFNLGNRNIRLLGQFIIDSIFNDGKVEPLSSKIILDSTTSKNIVLRNRSGLNLFDLQLVDGGNVVVKREGSKVTPQTHLYVGGTLNFAGPVTLSLGDSTNLHITNTDLAAIINHSSNRFVVTSRTSGSLIRNFSNSGLPKTYVFPVGSNEGGNNYARAEVTISSMTTSGKLGIRTSPGDYGGFPGGHARLSAAPNAEYIKRYWTIDSVTTNFTGLVRFYYNQPEVVGFESNYTRMGRWNPVREQLGGVWTQYFNPTIDTVANYFQTNNGFSSADLTGDWTIGNIFAFRRIFFSRQSGNWNDPNSWTYSPTHNGPIFGPGLWPDNSLDSAVIGGGDGGSYQPHEITLNVNANIQGTALGTSATNRGILNTNFNILTGDYFTMGDYSHLKITSADGITTIGNALGNIQTTQTRSYNLNFGIFEYNGNTNQSIGNGLPTTIWNLIINNSGTTNNNIVTIDKNLQIQNNLLINQGALNLSTFTANNSTGNGTLTINPNARLIIGGSNNMSTAANNYLYYNIHTDSFVEFSGNVNQQIDLLPTNLTNGFGNVDLTNSGTKIVSNPLLIRGNLTNYSPATLMINAIDALQINKNVINHSSIINSGVLEIGQ